MAKKAKAASKILDVVSTGLTAKEWKRAIDAKKAPPHRCYLCKRSSTERTVRYELDSKCNPTNPTVPRINLQEHVLQYGDLGILVVW